MEIEIKLPLASRGVDHVLASLEAAGVALGDIQVQTDVYFKERGFRNKVSGPGSYTVRVRYEGERCLLTLKKLTTVDGAWEELETEIKDGKVAERIIAEIGAEPAVIVKKRRRAGWFKEIEVALDEVECLDTYLELALNTDDNVIANASNSRLLEFAHQLGLAEVEPELRGYPTILLEREGVRFSAK